MDDQVKGLLSGAGTHNQPASPLTVDGLSQSILGAFSTYTDLPIPDGRIGRQKQTGERERQRECVCLPVQMMATVVVVVSPRGERESIASGRSKGLTCG